MKRTTQEITVLLFDKLWNQYIERVPYAKQYVDLVTQKNGKVVIDHIAFRTFNAHTGEQPEGIRAIRHILNFLGYKPVTKYSFPKMKLKATHFECQDESLPKIFVSQLEVGELPEWAQNAINTTVNNTTYLITDKSIELLRILEQNGALPSEAAGYLVDDLVRYFRRPWNIPLKEDVLKLNDISQYGAWVLLHGNSVNHFAALVNSHEVQDWPDLETTGKALAEAGVPMKEHIEGEIGGPLQQTATLAVKEEVKVKSEAGIENMMWTYAYFELTQRGYIVENGIKKLFSGFVGEQANHFFNMTRTREN
ncbi:MAG: DUF1338 domain-containing protein [Bacteroidetes bacterium]|nr:MAG: DUF1338 domain-containing protein [Bacteroidota bacterium]